MRELRIDKWCDLCLVDDADARVPAVKPFLADIRDLDAYPLTELRRPESRVVEVCQAHADTMDAMQRLVAGGTTAERFATMTAEAKPKAKPKPRAKAEPKPEPEPEPKAEITFNPKAEPSRAVCDICGDECLKASMVAHLTGKHGATPIRQPKRCPDCPAKPVNSNGMIVHRVRAHGYDLRGEMVAQVRARQPALTDT